MLSRMTLRSIFLEHSGGQWFPAYRYGFLLLNCALLAFGLHLLITTSPQSYHGNRYAPVVVSSMMVLNHLAFNFRPRPAVTVALRILCTIWTAFGMLYVFWLNRWF